MMPAVEGIAMHEQRFSGFPGETFEFLRGIGANNDKSWFESNRDLYEAGYVAPGRAFVEAVGPRLQRISPAVRYEPKINGSISRINRDIRFSTDKRPYKDHLDLWFWHGDKRGWDCPGFYMRVTAETVMLGSGMHGLQKEQLAAFRDAVVDGPSGNALVSAIGMVRKSGPYEIGGGTRKTPPRGYRAPAGWAALLLHEGLYAGLEFPADEARKPDFAEEAVKHFAATWPVGEWLMEEVAGR